MNENEKTPQDESSQEQEPQLFALTRDATGYRLDRRSFLKAASLAAATTVLSAKSAAENKSQRLQGNKMLIPNDYDVARLPLAHKGKVFSLALSADGSLLASGGADQTVKLWALPEGKLSSKRPSPSGDTITVFLSSGGKLLASGGSATKGVITKFWPLPKGKGPADLKSFAVAMSADGKLLAGMADNSIVIWSLPGRKKLAVLKGVDSESPNSVSLSGNGKMLACVGNSDNKVIKLWTELPNEKNVLELTGHNGPVRAVSISPDGMFLASGGVEGVRLWSLPGGTVLTMMKELVSPTAVLAFSGDGKLLASGHSDGSVRLWEVPTGKQLETFKNRGDPVIFVALTSDAKFLLTGTDNGRIFLRELDDEKRCWVLFDPDIEQDQFKASAYDEQGKVLAGTVCTCDLVCTCNTVWVPGGMALPHNTTCTCNTIMVGKPKAGAETKVETTRVVEKGTCVCDTICTCDINCICNTVSRPSSNTGGGTYRGGGGHYWRPN